MGLLLFDSCSNSTQVSVRGTSHVKNWHKYEAYILTVVGVPPARAVNYEETLLSSMPLRRSGKQKNFLKVFGVTASSRQGECAEGARAEVGVLAVTTKSFQKFFCGN